jgi:hypothetical protein
MENGRINQLTKDVSKELSTSSSVPTLQNLKDELLRKAKSTGKTWRFYMHVNEDGSQLTTVTSDREEIQNIVAEKGSETRERINKEDWQKAKRKAYLKKVTIKAILEGLTNSFKNIFKK